MFQAFNTSGTLQFDVESFTYRHVETKAATVNFINGGGLLPSGYLARINPTATWDTFAVRCTKFVFLTEGSEVSYDGRASAREIHIGALPEANGQSVTGYFFQPAKTSTITSSQNFGMQIFNNVGDLLYSSELVPLRVVHYVPPGTAMPYSVTLPAGRTYALGAVGVNGAIYGPAAKIHGKVNSNVIDIDDEGSTSTTGVIVVDVTGY